MAPAPIGDSPNLFLLGGAGRREPQHVPPPKADPSAVVRLYANLFQPSFKLQEEARIGARVNKRYHPPVPPAARVLTHPGVAEDNKPQRAMMETADPVLLFAGIRASQEELGRRSIVAA